MKINMLFKAVAQLSMLAAVASVVQPAAAFTDCLHYPEDIAKFNQSITRGACLFGASFGSDRQTATNTNRVRVVITSNNSGAQRKAIITGLKGSGSPIGAGCVAATTQLNVVTSNSPATGCNGVLMTGLRLQMQQ